MTAVHVHRPFLDAVPSLLPDLSSPLRALPAVFVGGVLTSLTPCIYPMIPITAAIVGGTSVGERAPERAPARGGRSLLTLTYVFGLALVYSALGLFAGIIGNAVRLGEYQSVAVLRDGEPAAPRGAGDARRDAGAGAGVDSRARDARRGQRGACPARSRWERCRVSSPRRARRR